MAALQRTCRALQGQLQGLSPIVKEYVEHWMTCDRGPSVPPPEVPINGDLRGWMSELRDGLLVVQSHIDGFAHGGPYSPPTPTHVFHTFNEASGSRIRAFNDTLASCDAELDGLRDTMAEFLPIIRWYVCCFDCYPQSPNSARRPDLTMLSDYGEFRTQHMNLVSNPEPMTYRNSADSAIAILREALYTVRDEIQNIVDMLVTMRTVDDSPPIPSEVPAIIRRLNKLREALMLILTNNASEWLESDLCDQRRILTYTAFVALSPETLRDGAEALAEIRRELDVDGAYGRAAAGVSREMVYRHQLALLMEGGQMEELQSVPDGLESLLLSGS
ncbi:hypothetical protein ACRE_077120 [Hapsidospora chrysogenum ATCC 11550]|uniref:Uncharacterized protein n=1 Tax=Hapsidospora chrysogenum (strain ATCC 11550 / CBS 779.69 / DSM 880 / IAM 14645 / JCM 23072 / IMI 49137) TaxID=857340 RepID=A0A086SWU8_HAPC1|nr:hypothetical protein ACRE_077120 [Hapsidospora chrysogenum ATCC 11550]